MIERQILKVIYSPFKAFEDIVKNPAAKGPLLVLLLCVVAAAVVGFVSLSKVDVQLHSEIGPYVSLATTSTFGGRVLWMLIDEALLLSLSWFILSGMILLLVKAFRVNGVSWRIIFFVIGYTLITSMIRLLITALLISPLPTVRLGWGIWNPEPGTEDVASQKILEAYEPWFSSPVYRFLSYLPYILQVWVAALAAIAVHALFGVSWNKAVAISLIASGLTFLIRLFLF